MSYQNNVSDTLFADVSEFQVPVDDSYLDAGYRVLSIRSNDGTHRDLHWAPNITWTHAAANAGRLDCFIVYAYWRPNWQATLDTMKDQIISAGGPHPKMAVMLDVESGGNPGGDQSDGINQMYWGLANWLGNSQRVIGYANGSDFNNMWPTRPNGLRVIGAGYGRNPNLPGQIAHQYTDGNGFDSELPQSAPPFGNCDMNSADGLSSVALAAAMGIVVGLPPPPPVIVPPPVVVTPPVSPGLPALPTDDSIYVATVAIAKQFAAT